MEKQKFDGYAQAYDGWFIKNENVFNSEFLLLQKVLGNFKNKKVLSVGCGSGLFESNLDNMDCITGIEPSQDMAEIALKRGIKVEVVTAEKMELVDDYYDIIYFNGSSSYIEDLSLVYSKCQKALKNHGKLILLDVPKESAFGYFYLLAKTLNTYDSEILDKIKPNLPYPLELVKSGYWYTSEEKIAILKQLGFDNFKYYQTLINNPIYTNEGIEEVVEGYKQGGYIAIVAEKND